MGEMIHHDPMLDANTLAEAEVIRNDLARYNAARVAANQLAKDALVRAKTFDKVKKTIYPTMEPGHPVSMPALT